MYMCICVCVCVCVFVRVRVYSNFLQKLLYQYVLSFKESMSAQKFIIAKHTACNF